MHSSRMRTTRFSGRLSCHAPPKPHMPPHVMYTPTPPHPHHACPLPCMPPLPCHAHPPCHTCPRHAPPLLWTEGMTHTCENITLPQTSFAGGNNISLLVHFVLMRYQLDSHRRTRYLARLSTPDENLQ